MMVTRDVDNKLKTLFDGLRIPHGWGLLKNYS